MLILNLLYQLFNYYPDNLFNSTQISLTEASNVNPFVLGTYTDTYVATAAVVGGQRFTITELEFRKYWV